MAGFSKMYCIGGSGGFMGSDGLNSIWLQILVGDASRQWLEAHYHDAGIKPLGKIETIIPSGPDHPNALIDACIAFFPDPFQDCPAFAEVQEQAKDMTCLDFDSQPSQIPSGWNTLREQAVGTFKELGIYESDLKRLDLSNWEAE
jgi:hypothetical protein